MYDADIKNQKNTPYKFAIYAYIFLIIISCFTFISNNKWVNAENEVELTLSTNTQILIPGEINPIKFTLKNNGDRTANSLSLTINMPSSSQIQESVMYIVKGDGKHHLKDLNSGESIDVIENIYVNPKSANSITSIQVKILCLTADEPEELRSIGFTIGSLQSIGAIINVKTSTNTLVSGNNNFLNLYIKNSGNSTANNVDITMALPGGGVFSPLTFVDSDGNWHLDTIKANDTANIPIKLFATPSSAGNTYLVNLLINYSDKIRQWQITRYLSLGVPYPLTKGAVLDVKIDDQNLASGSINEREITLFNSGDDTARNIIFSISTPNTQSFAIIGADNSWNIDSIEPGQSYKIPIKFFITAASTGVTYSLPVNVSYLDNIYRQKQESFGISVIVFGNVVIDVLDSSTYPTTIVQGKPFSITSTIINLGTTTAQSVTIIPKANSDMQPLTSSTIFIGDLSTNVPSSITITFLATNIKNQTYPVEVEYNYRLSTSQKFTGKISIPVKILATNKVSSTDDIPPSNTQPNLLFQYVLFVVIILILVITLYVFYQRRVKN